MDGVAECSLPVVPEGELVDVPLHFWRGMFHGEIRRHLDLLALEVIALHAMEKVSAETAIRWGFKLAMGMAEMQFARLDTMNDVVDEIRAVKEASE